MISNVSVLLGKLYLCKKRGQSKDICNFTKSELFHRYFAKIFLVFNKTFKILSRIWKQLLLRLDLKMVSSDNYK